MTRYTATVVAALALLGAKCEEPPTPEELLRECVTATYTLATCDLNRLLFGPRCPVDACRSALVVARFCGVRLEDRVHFDQYTRECTLPPPVVVP